jgi:hypothetical protein
VNIKTTSTNTKDNVGNLAICVQSYTNHNLNLQKSYDNGIMSLILINKLKNKEYNHNIKKDYYFVVLNKKDPTDVIINSVLGLAKISPNINNLPFQVCWDKNRKFVYDNINIKVMMFLKCLQNLKENWRGLFLKNIKSIETVENIRVSRKRKREDTSQDYEPNAKRQKTFSYII